MKKSTRTKVIDILLLCMIILPFLFCITLKVLTKPASADISITGAQVYFTIPMPVMDLPITESQVTSLMVMIAMLGLCLYLTHGIAVVPNSKRQLVAEFVVEKAQHLVDDNMGKRFSAFAPFVAAIMALSAFSSLSSLLGLFPPTSDMNIVAGWAILVFVLITHYKLKGGLFSYVKGFFEPVFIFAPFNIIGEIATPVSMSFRHYGNVLSGVVISTLVAYALQSLSHMLLGWLPGVLGQFPLLQIGLPAILSLYFDIFSGLMQAFIFAMLTMLYIATGFPEEDYERRKAKRKALHAA
ncbi:MAG: F0F1 ATP synthase subunit A [Clostridiales bacterium]|nr:F0F1 ATP synthase subunit A [Clostridiales bacterium]MDO4351118.1 FoF1 ATP synthase subunit a [Eubacteriales bacterium]MDY4008242.1 FoF1 ATP synthase subunit a [Candidatus Limiplasma sp.]